MSHNGRKKRRRRYRLRPWQRLGLVAVLVIVFAVSSTLFMDFGRSASGEDGEYAESGWTDSVYAYVLAEDDSLTTTVYNEGLAEAYQCGRGAAYVEIESWTPFVSETGEEYYHIFYNGQFGYILCEYITDDRSDLLQESIVYVRTPVTLLAEVDGVETGSLAEKGDALQVVGYDYFRDDGTVHMYEVKIGTDIGWINADYVVSTYAESMENWTNDSNVYATHVYRGDGYGGGDAADLDYWPHEKGDFANEGNEMPESVYAVYVIAEDANPEKIAACLEEVEGTEINTFVFTVYDNGKVAYPSEVLESYGVLDDYYCGSTMEEFAEAVQMVKDAGYYCVARIACFRDKVMAAAYPEWAVTDTDGNPFQIDESYWLSAYCREAWEMKVSLAVEVVDDFGFNEVQFDFVRFPNLLLSYENEGTVDVKNTYNESKAQAVQRFLTYATDILHDHGAYVAVDMLGETSNDYVAPCGQYWPAISTVVDVICGMPYPDHFSSYYSGGTRYVPYEHPYETLYSWAVRVALRQNECSSPAIVRTWIQTWDDSGYTYDSLAIQRQILGLYDADITGGYMLWYGNGTLYIAEKLEGVIEYDYYELYQQAEEAGELLSNYMGVSTDEDEDED
ncbi:MAG: putative glycoside hydrolase [Oscillospiraceae bacterium]|nr:putative glycoside hydrolase [Oscillospiraceae bacterium]